MYIGLSPHLEPMGTTIKPRNVEVIKMLLDGTGRELVPAHVLGATITGRGPRWTGKQREFAQLGMVLVRPKLDVWGRPHLLPIWYRTRFVFAAEIDEHGRAASLWLLYYPPGYLYRITGPARTYPEFDLLHIANLDPRQVTQGQNVAFQLQFDGISWRQRIASGQDWQGGLGIVGLDFVDGLQPVHYVNVLLNSTGQFTHAPWVLKNLFMTLPNGEKTYIWFCEGCPNHQLLGCPAMITENWVLAPGQPPVCPMFIVEANQVLIIPLF